MVLTNKQKDDLHAAILGYLRTAGMEKAAEAFSAEAGLDGVALEDRFGSLLEKKWSAIVRLQRKVLNLEQANASLQEDLRDYGKGKRVDKSELLPREPAAHTLSGHRGPVTRVAFHPSYNMVVSASEDTFVRVWDADTGAADGQMLRGHTDAVQDVAFNGDGTLLATCSADLSVRVWNFEKRKCVKTLNGHEHNVSSVAWHGANLFSASRDKTVRMWDTTSGYCTRTFTGHDGWVRCVRVSADGATMATASMDHTVKIWNVQTGECVRTLREHDHVVETLEFSDNAAAERNLRAIMAAEGGGAPAAAEEAKEDGGAAEAAQGAFLVSGSRDKTIRVWEVATGRLVKTMSHDNWVRGLVFHPSGRYLLSGADDKSVRVWDLSKNCRLSRTINDAHPLFVSSVAWNKAQPMMATGGVDSSVKIWSCR